MKDKFLVPHEYKLPKADFMALVEDQIEHIRKTLLSKGNEYAPGQDDALHNFNVSMIMDQACGKETTREEVVWQYAKKHHISLMDAIYYFSKHQPEMLTIEFLNEKIGDLINYWIIMKASMLQTAKVYADTVPFPPVSLKYETTTTTAMVPRKDDESIHGEQDEEAVHVVNPELLRHAALGLVLGQSEEKLYEAHLLEFGSRTDEKIYRIVLTTPSSPLPSVMCSTDGSSVKDFAAIGYIFQAINQSAPEWTRKAVTIINNKLKI